MLSDEHQHPIPRVAESIFVYHDTPVICFKAQQQESANEELM